MLAELVRKAHEKNISRVLLTCDESNWLPAASLNGIVATFVLLPTGSVNTGLILHRTRLEEINQQNKLPRNRASIFSHSLQPIEHPVDRCSMLRRREMMPEAFIQMGFRLMSLFT